MKWFNLLIVLFLSSCTGNHYHDGIYKSDLVIANMELEIRGNDVYIRTKSELDPSLEVEAKGSCIQYEDRIEITNADGIKYIVRPDKNGNISFAGVEFEKVGGKGNKSVATTKKPKKLEKVPAPQKATTTKYIVPEEIYDVYESADGKYSDKYNVSVSRNGDIAVITSADPDNNIFSKAVFEGRLKKDGRIYDYEGNILPYRFKERVLYMDEGNGVWDKYIRSSR